MQPGQGAAAAIGRDECFAERALMQALLHLPKRIAARLRSFRRGRPARVGQPEREPRAEPHRVPLGNEGRDDGEIPGRGHAEEIDDREPVFTGFAQQPVVPAFRIFPLECIADGFVALLDLVCVALVVVPDPPARPGCRGPDRQDRAHLLRLEDAPGAGQQVNTFAPEHETLPQGGGGDRVVFLAEFSDMHERRIPHPVVVGNWFRAVRQVHFDGCFSGGGQDSPCPAALCNAGIVPVPGLPWLSVQCAAPDTLASLPRRS